MPDAVIVAACRTAIGTARLGTLVEAHPFDMASETVREAVARCGLTSGLPATNAAAAGIRRARTGQRVRKAA